MDSGAVQGLAHIDIAEPRNDVLVEQQQLDRGTAAGKAASQLPRVDIERLRSERFELRPLIQPVGRHEIKRSKPPRIVERELPSLVGLDQEMVMLSDLARV